MFELLKLPAPADLQQRNRGRSAPGGGQAAAIASQATTSDGGPGEGIAGRGATTVDALFGELRFEAVPGRVWAYSEDPVTKARSLKSIDVRTGITDGTYAELLDARDIGEDTVLLTAVTSRQQVTTPLGANPLMPGRRMGGGGDHGPH